MPQRHRLGRCPSTPSPLIEIPDKGIEFRFDSFENPCIQHSHILVEFRRNYQEQFSNLFANDS